MAPIKTKAALLVLAASLGACGPVNKSITPIYNPGVNSINQPVVQRTDFVLDLSTAGNGVPAAELDRLSSWFDSLQLGYGDRVFLDQPYGYEQAASRDDVARVAGAYGLLLNEGAPVTAGTVQPGAVRVIVSRSSASVPGCPNWDYAGMPGAPITTAPGYGCAINSNLAAMVADPADLVLGQTGSGDGDAQTASKAIRVHRQKVPTGSGGLTATSTAGGN